MEGVPADSTQAHPSQSPSSTHSRPQLPHHPQSEGPASSLQMNPGPSNDEPPSKRRRMSSDMAPRSAYEQDQRVAQQSLPLGREPYGQPYSREQPSALRGSYYPPGPLSASAVPAADYAFGHHRNNSSSTSSPFVSPRHEFPSYSFYPANHPYPQTARDYEHQYQQGHYAFAQPRPVPYPDQHSYRPPVPSSVPPQYDQSRQYTRTYAPDDHGHGDRGYNSTYSTARPNYPSSQHYDRPSELLPRTLPPPTQPLSSVLPPLPTTTLPSSQPLRENHPSQPSSGGSSFDGNAHLQPGGQNGLDSRGDQGHGQSAYRPPYYPNPAYQPPYQGREPGR